MVLTSVQQRNRNHVHDKQWVVDRSRHAIVTPKDVKEEDVRAFFAEINKKHGQRGKSDILFDWMLCCGDEAVQSGNQIMVYNRDNSVTPHNFCVTCCYEAIKSIVSNFYNEDDNQPKLQELLESTESVSDIPVLGATQSERWPVIPLGQLMWALTSEKQTESVAKTWFTAVVFHALHSAPQIEWCPAHPSVLMRNTGPDRVMKCSVPQCNFFLCSQCHGWHKQRACPQDILPPGFRKCPNCGRVIEKTAACNHITCKCGIHFCYYCGAKKSGSAHEIYDHLRRRHKDCFNNPPDYRRYCLHEQVDDAELDRFYKDYPHLRPVTSPSSQTRTSHGKHGH